MLSKTEIQKLFDFTRKKYVRYIDVQVELVDHLATAIEELRSQDQSLSFDVALQKVYSRFPITGFNDLIQEKVKVLNFFWWSKLKNYMISFMTWPKLLWFVLVFMIFYMMSSLLNSNMFFAATLVITLLVIIYGELGSISFFRKNISKYLSLSTYYGFCSGIFFFLPQIMIQFLIGRSVVLLGTLQIVVCVLLSIYLLAIYALFIVFPKQIKADILREYKDYIPQIT